MKPMRRNPTRIKFPHSSILVSNLSAINGIYNRYRSLRHQKIGIQQSQQFSGLAERHIGTLDTTSFHTFGQCKDSQNRKS